MKASRKKIIIDGFNAEDFGVLLASLQTSIERVIRVGVRDQQEAKLLTDLYRVRDKLLAGLGTTYEAYKKSFDARTEETV